MIARLRLRAALAAALVITLSSPLMAQARPDTLLPGDPRLHPDRIEEHTATHEFIQYGASGEVVVGRLSRSVERVNHTAAEPSILVSMQMRNPTRSGLDIVYLDAESLASTVRYLTAPTGMTTRYQMGDNLHVTYSGRDGVRVSADTVLATPRFAGADDLVFASLDLAEGSTVHLPGISGAANTLEGSLVVNQVTFLGLERVEIPGIWSGTARRFESVRADGSTVSYWISQQAPHLLRQDFFTADGVRFLRWELVEYSEGPVGYGPN